MTKQRDPERDPIEEKTRSRRNFADLFPSSIVEKVSRQIDLLEAMFQHKFLRERIILGGASALIYVHFDEPTRIATDLAEDLSTSPKGPPRVTTDIDCDYRHSGHVQWEEERQQVEDALQEVFEHAGFSAERNRTRKVNRATLFSVHYRDTGQKQEHFKVELNFMRRYPLLEDCWATLKDPMSKREFKVQTVRKEQAFANKWRTMISRNKTSDMFDVYHISRTNFEWDPFSRCAVLECMLELPRPIQEIDMENKILGSLDLSYRSLLPQGMYDMEKLKLLRHPVLKFSRKVLKHLTEEDLGAIERFFTDLETPPRQLVREIVGTVDRSSVLSPRVVDHPQLYSQIEAIRTGAA